MPGFSTYKRMQSGQMAFGINERDRILVKMLNITMKETTASFIVHKYNYIIFSDKKKKKMQNRQKVTRFRVFILVTNFTNIKSIS